jgi:hypothetical protein
MMLGDWSDNYSLSQITVHNKLPDHARGLIDHSPTMLRDSSTMTYTMLGDCCDYSSTMAWGLVSSATWEI